MSKRKFGTIKCLLHFDYPYFNEPGDGLDDEVGLETWSKEANAALYGSAAPNAGTQAPKFGYRCLYPYNGGATCNNSSGIFNLRLDGEYEFEMFVYTKAHGNGTRTLFSLYENTFGTLELGLSSSGKLKWTVFSGTVSLLSAVLTAEAWHHVLVRFMDATPTVFVDGVEQNMGSFQLAKDMTVTKVTVGTFTDSAYPIFIDEFVFRHSAGSAAPTVPAEPYSGVLDISAIGGYGTGADGDVTFTSSYGLGKSAVISSVSGLSITVNSWSSTGIYLPEAGREVMIHVTAPQSETVAEYPEAGLYAFKKIVSVDGTTLELDEAISAENGDDFTLDNTLLNTYYVQVIVVPNFTSLTVNAGITISSQSWNTSSGGGILAFRCTGNCTINGNILTSGTGAIRYDTQQMTHSKLVDRFLCSMGGGIFAACGGTFCAGSTARLGASWSGLGENGNGAAGYGGNGGNVNPTASVSVAGGAGGVGGGGGGASCASTTTSNRATGGACGMSGSSATTGGGGGGCGGNGGNGSSYAGGSGGGGQGGSGGAGGTGKEQANYSMTNTGNSAQGVNGGDTSVYSTPLPISASTTTSYPSGAGGGGSGGNGGFGMSFKSWGVSGRREPSGGCAGASVILICNKLAVDEVVLSTGGGAGETSAFESGFTKIGGSGGGGTGFCYIACNEKVSS